MWSLLFGCKPAKMVDEIEANIADLKDENLSMRQQLNKMHEKRRADQALIANLEEEVREAKLRDELHQMQLQRERDERKIEQMERALKKQAKMISVRQKPQRRFLVNSA